MADILDDHLLPEYADKFDFSELSLDAIIRFKEFAFEHEALVSQSLLRQSGIPSFTTDSNMTTIFSGFNPGIGGVGLYILKEHKELATQVLHKDTAMEYVDQATKVLFKDAEEELEQMQKRQDELSEKNNRILMFAFVFFIIVLLILGLA